MINSNNNDNNLCCVIKLFIICMVDVDFDMFFQLADSTSRYTRGHCKKLCKPLCNSAFIAGTHWHRVINIWNALPDSCYSSQCYFIQETSMSC